MDAGQKRVPARFYKTAAGGEPVREWLLSLEKEERRQIGTDIATVEYGWPIGMPTCRPMGGGLHEVRTDLETKRIARVLFCIHDQQTVLLHAFIKKTPQTPKADIDLARKRMKEVTK